MSQQLTAKRQSIVTAIVDTVDMQIVGTQLTEKEV